MSGAKHNTEARECIYTLVEEHSYKRRSHTERSGGVIRRENAGMSSEKEVRVLLAEYLRFPE